MYAGRADALMRLYVVLEHIRSEQQLLLRMETSNINACKVYTN